MRTTRGWITCGGVPLHRLRSHFISGMSCLCTLLLAACQGSIHLVLAAQPRRWK